jgi:RNA polymerase sigma-70 factor (ECF subfamily)
MPDKASIECMNDRLSTTRYNLPRRYCQALAWRRKPRAAVKTARTLFCEAGVDAGADLKVLTGATFPRKACNNNRGMMPVANVPPERRLIEQALAGDNRAFRQLVERYQGAVFNIAYRMLGDREEAKDVAQEAFWRAHRGLGGFDLNRPLAPWLYRIVTNLSLNRLRRGPPPTVSLDAPPPGQPDDAAPLQVADPDAGPADRLLRAEAQNQVRQAILVLAPADRVVIELRHFQGLSYAEIASVLDTSLSSVKSRLFRARRKLRDRLADLIE